MIYQISKIEKQKKCLKKNSKYFIFYFLILICVFDFYVLIFKFNYNAYALNLDKLKISFLNQDYKAAITEGEKMLANTDKESDLDELYYLLGLSYMKDGNLLRASDIFEIILKEFKKGVFIEDAKIGLADTYFLMGDYYKSKNYLLELLNTNPESKYRSILYYRISQCLEKTGDANGSEEYLSKLNKEFPLNLESGEKIGIGDLISYYSVQVGSFSKKANADNLLRKLTGENYDVYIEENQSSGKTSYRVKAGKLKLRKEAEILEMQLSKEGYPTKITP